MTIKDKIFLVISFVFLSLLAKSEIEKSHLRREIESQRTSLTNQLIALTEERDEYKVSVEERDKSIEELYELLSRSSAEGERLSEDLKNANSRIYSLTEVVLSVRSELELTGDLHGDTISGQFPDSSSVSGVDGSLTYRVSYLFPPTNLFRLDWESKINLQWVETVGADNRCLLFVRSNDPKVRISMESRDCSKSVDSSDGWSRTRSVTYGAIAALLGVKVIPPLAKWLSGKDE